MTRGFVAAVLLMMSSAAFAAPQSIGDCEKITDPDAYNRCLAAFGPAARTGTREAQPVPANADQPKISRSGRGRGGFARRGGRGGRAFTRGGRVRMEISVGGGSRAKRGGRRRRR